MMTDKEAAPITWEALTEEEHDEHEGREEHPPFDKRTIKRAIYKGLDPSGQELDSLMPRWEMNQTELEAIISFLQRIDRIYP